MSVALVNIRQEKNESLQTFMKRFKKIALNILNLDPIVAIHHLIMALWLGPFVNSLCKKPTTGLDELRMRATKYMHMRSPRMGSFGLPSHF